MTDRRARVLVLGAVAVLVGYYFLWQARAATGPFAWRGDKNGFYNLLARGFLAGHLYTTVTPSPQLLALPDPWDPHVEDSLRWQDMVLYNGHYYLYFGAAPAALLFAPWRLLTGNDLPEPFALVLLCFSGFLFACGALLRFLELAGARPGPVRLGLLFLALGICQGAPFLLNRAVVYEIAIASGFCSVAGGLFFLARGVGPDARRWNLAASGMFFGLAVASRPHLIFAGAIALLALAVYSLRRGVRGFLWFAAAWALIGAGIAVYNYQRFGSPVEFGFRYQLSGPGQNRVDLAAGHLPPGLYYMLLARPEFTPVFPWMRLVFRFPFDSAERHPLPPDYFVEPTVGALWLAPFLLALLLGWRRAKFAAETRLVAGIAITAGAVILVFLMSTHLASQRYEVDFLPLLVFAAVAAIGIAHSRAIAIAGCLLIIYSAAANLALAVQGPYDDYLHNRPASYLKLARRFSPVAEHRPLWSPRIELRLEARFAEHAYREPIVTIGRAQFCYFLYAEWTATGLRIVSKTNDSQLQFEMPHPGSATVPLQLNYTPESGEVRVTVGGREAIVQRVGPLVTAPSQVTPGANDADTGLTSRRFTGDLRVLEKRVEERGR